MERERRQRKSLQVYFAALDPESFDRVLRDVESMDQIQLLRLHCKLNAALQRVELKARLQEEAAEAAGLLGLSKPDTIRPPSSSPPEALEIIPMPIEPVGIFRP
jgi:hypothetical protein